MSIIYKKIHGAYKNPILAFFFRPFYYFSCMGAVIAPNILITAAHCKNELELPKVGLPKDFSLKGITEFYYTAKGVKKVILHEELDMALLLISDQDYNSLNLQPVSIPDEPISEVTDAHFYGHGGSLTTGLITFKKIPLKKSKLSLKNRNILSFLVEYQSNLKNKICRRDSGTPIIKKFQNQPDEILALFSEAYIEKKDDDSSEKIRCSIIGVAVSIAKNKKWIDESIKKLIN